MELRFALIADVDALIRGLKDGSFKVISTDHAPHAVPEKTGSIRNAAFGIVGIVKSAQVSSKYQGGDYEGAVQASRDAKKWSMIALICGLVGYLLYLIVVIAGVVLW